MILKDPYKTINNKARLPIFLLKVSTNHSGSMPHIFSILSLFVQATGGERDSV